MKLVILLVGHCQNGPDNSFIIDTFKGRSSGGDYATFSLEEWLNRTVYS